MGRPDSPRSFPSARQSALPPVLISETAWGLPSPITTPSPDMPRSSTPAASPMQSPLPAPTCAFPYTHTVGRCFLCMVTRLNRVHLRCGLPVALSTLRRLRYLGSARLDSRWVASPWRGWNCTSWSDVVSSWRTRIAYVRSPYSQAISACTDSWLMRPVHGTGRSRPGVCGESPREQGNSGRVLAQRAPTPTQPLVHWRHGSDGRRRAF
jgi:hypothetical protein